MHKVVIAFAFFCVLAVVSAEPIPVVRHVSTFNRKDVYEPSGAYRSKFDTDLGINVDEEGDVVHFVNAAGQPDSYIVKRGSYGYYGDDGLYYSVSWVADENGFRATGDHLPKV